MRLRSQAVWAFVLAGISTGGVVVGVFQYFILGAVFVRPGHAPAEGRDALPVNDEFPVLVVRHVFPHPCTEFIKNTFGPLINNSFEPTRLV